MKIFWILYIGIVLTVAAACEKETSVDFPEDDLPPISIECTITNENIRHSVTILEPYHELNMAPKPIENAFVWIISGSDTIRFPYHEDKGKYVAQKTFQASVNNAYVLLVLHEKNYYSSLAQCIPATIPSEVGISQTDSVGYFTLRNSYSSLEQAMWQFTLLTPDSVEHIVYRYSFESIAVNEIFSPAKENIVFTPGTIITWKKYSLTDNHAEYLRFMLSETEWNGGFFDVMRTNVPTNLTNGAVGYFGVCTVAKGELKVE